MIVMTVIMRTRWRLKNQSVMTHFQETVARPGIVTEVTAQTGHSTVLPIVAQVKHGAATEAMAPAGLGAPPATMAAKKSSSVRMET